MNPWEQIPDEWLDEISISLDHRLAEAVAGNAYVHTREVTEALESLYHHYPHLRVND